MKVVSAINLICPRCRRRIPCQRKMSFAGNRPNLGRKSFRRVILVLQRSVKPVDPVDLLNPNPTQAVQRCWMRCGEPLPDDPRIHQCVLAYLSDWSLLDTASRPHGVSFMQENVQVASLDHAMWFHRSFRADEWLLYDQDSPSASGARGFNRGLIYNQTGKLVASTTQEGLLRIYPQ